MSVVVSIAVAAVSAFAGLASLLVYVYFVRRSDLSTAREEALALAETRRQVIVDLRARVAALEDRNRRSRAQSGRRIRELETALGRARTEARDEAYRTQHFYAAALGELLDDLRGDLGRVPPDVDSALARIEKLLVRQTEPH